MSSSHVTSRPEDVDDGYVSEEDQVAAERPAVDQPPIKQCLPADVTVDDVTMPPPESAAPLSLNEFLQRLKDAAKRGPGRPRKRRGEAAAELNELALMTPAQRTARMTKITEKLAAAEKDRASLEARRGDIDVLDDAALDAYHADLARAEAVCVTLHKVSDNLGAALQRIEAAETARAFEDRARRTVAKNAETYAADLQALHDLTEKIADLGPSLEEARNAIEHVNAQAQERGRPDLCISVERLRRLTNQEGGSPVPATSPSVIERMGESDDDWNTHVLSTLAERAAGVYRSQYPGSSSSAKGREVQIGLRRAKEIFVAREGGEDDEAYVARQWASVAQYLNCHRAGGEDETEYATRLRNALARELKVSRKGESEEAYQLRVSNAHAQRLRSTQRQDPLVESAKAAARVIEAHCISIEMGEAHRHQLRLQRFVRWGESQT